MIERRKTKTMGVGVFTMIRVPTGKIIDTCSASPFSAGAWPAIRNSEAGVYAFLDRKAYARCKSPADPCKGFFAWGDVTMVNHSDDPNAEIKTYKCDGDFKVDLVALRPIENGEQVFIKYANGNDPELYPWHGN